MGKILPKALIGLFAVFLTLAYFVNLGGTEYFTAVSWAITFSCILVSMYFSFKALQFFGIESLQGKGALAFLLAMASWFVADVISMLINSSVSGVSVADFFFMLGYAPFILSLGFGVFALKPGLLDTPWKKVGAILGIAGIILGYLNFFPLTWNPEISSLENLVVSGYVIFDAILLTGILFLVYVTLSGAISVGWIVLGLGVLCTLSGDILYSLNFESYAPNGNNLLDLFYYYGYLLYGMGFLLMRERTEELLNPSAQGVQKEHSKAKGRKKK